MSATANPSASTGTATRAAASANETVWPTWSSAALFASGLTLLVLETPNLLGLVGLVLLAIGIYGLAYRRKRREA